MKIIEVQVADENVEFFNQLVEELRLSEPHKEPSQMPEWHKEILDQRLAEDDPSKDRPAEDYFNKYRERGI